MRNLLKTYPAGSYLVVPQAEAIPLRVSVLGYGYEVADSHSYFWDGMKRGKSPFAIFQYAVAGMGRVWLDGKEHTILPGMAMLVEVPQKHQYFLPNDSDRWEFIWVNLIGVETMRIWRAMTKVTGPAATLPDESTAVETAKKILEFKFRKEAPTPYEVTRLAYQFLTRLVEELLPESDRNHKPDFILKVTDYCLTHLNRTISVDDLAREADYSKYHFNRLFKDYQGITPMAFLNQLRINQALRLLQTTRLTVKEIATQCGFEDPSYFCKVFRNHHHVSPGEFRNQAQLTGIDVEEYDKPSEPDGSLRE